MNLELWPLLYIVFNGFSAQLLFNRKRLHGIKKFCGIIMGMCILITRYFRFKYFSKYLNIIYFEYLMCALSYIHHVAMSTNVMYVSCILFLSYLICIIYSMYVWLYQYFDLFHISVLSLFFDYFYYVGCVFWTIGMHAYTGQMNLSIFIDGIINRLNCYELIFNQNIL